VVFGRSSPDGDDPGGLRQYKKNHKAALRVTKEKPKQFFVCI
jgi:hypothetical protein